MDMQLFNGEKKQIGWAAPFAKQFWQIKIKHVVGWTKVVEFWSLFA